MLGKSGFWLASAGTWNSEDPQGQGIMRAAVDVLGLQYLGDIAVETSNCCLDMKGSESTAKPTLSHLY